MSDPPNNSNEPQCPCAPRCTMAVDVTLKTADGKILGAHASMLAAQSEIFPTPSMVTMDSEPAVLSEDSRVLIALLQLIHPLAVRNHESYVLTALTPHYLVPLAEACEKYAIDSVRGMCEAPIIRAAQYIPWEAFKYAMQYGHLNIANAAVKHTMETERPLRMVHMGSMDNKAVCAWYELREAYNNRYENVLSAFLTDPPLVKKSKGYHQSCRDWTRYRDEVIGDDLNWDATRTLLKTKGPEVVFHASRWSNALPIHNTDYEGTIYSNCKKCKVRAKQWERCVRSHSNECLPSFSEIYNLLT